MDKVYKHTEFEEKIYLMWEKSGYFTPKIDKDKKPFTIIMPPPNANAPLHIGHAVFVTIEDILIRYHRMLGQPSLWLPGADHAGILTQVVFERKLAEKGQTRYDLGREKFFSETMKFTLSNKKIMENQLRVLGASCDWTRNSFTLDPKFDKPIYTVFKKLYDLGLIYRDQRMINWCPRCQTALSDLEVEHREIKTSLWYIRYPLKSQKGFITVATTRPETMLGDTAIAVNPKDKRYKKLIGTMAILPLMNREIPLIGDPAVDPEFGTGAVKITPAHDPADFDIGQKHNLKILPVIGFNNEMTKNAGRYSGLKVSLARQTVLEDLNKLKLLENEKEYLHSVGRCERCKTTIEPLISFQWFVKTKPLAEKAIKAVKEKKIKIIPKRFEKIYFNWMENIKDWCVSRQIWWGHQFPVWYCLACSNLTKDEIEKLYDEKGLVLPIVKREIYSKLDPIIEIEKPKKCPKCTGTKLFRDPDTLDTWFSSGQWPYNTLGWLEKNQDFQYFYPTSVMETGYEILFFWVARMIMLGIFATGEIPFKTVYLHGLVRDAFGQKMSKSKGNVVNPIDMVEKYGADALRMALVMGNAPGSDSPLAENKIAGMRNFANKIWNIGRFILGNLEEKGYQTFTDLPEFSTDMPNLEDEDRKIIKDLNQTVEDVTKLIEHYHFGLASEKIYEFIWHCFADEYIEYSKERIKLGDKVVLSALRHVYLTCLKLLHPFMPFVTEAIWQMIPGKRQPLIISQWPPTINTSDGGPAFGGDSSEVNKKNV